MVLKTYNFNEEVKRLLPVEDLSEPPWAYTLKDIRAWIPIPTRSMVYDTVGEYDKLTESMKWRDHMQEVTVKRLELLEKVKENRTNHRAAFEAAVEGYRKTIVGRLEELLADAKAGKRIHHNIQLPVPMDQTAEYDQAIAMLEMSVDKEIKLKASEFACYAMDRWHWKAQFGMSNSDYVASTFVAEGEVPEHLKRALGTDD